MMFGKKKRSERQFSCNRCKNIWYGSVAPPRKVGRMEMSGARMQANGSRMSLFGKSSAAEMQLANLQNQQMRFANYGVCTSCGSKSYTSVVVKL